MQFTKVLPPERKYYVTLWCQFGGSGDHIEYRCEARNARIARAKAISFATCYVRRSDIVSITVWYERR